MKKRLISLLSISILPATICPVFITSCASKKQEFEFVGDSTYATAENSIVEDSEFILEYIPKSTATFKKFKYVGEYEFNPDLYTVEVQQQNNVFVNLTARINIPEDTTYEKGEFDIVVETTGFDDVNVPYGAYLINLIIRSSTDNQIMFSQNDFTFQVEETLMNCYDESETIFPKIEEYVLDDENKYHAMIEYDGFVWFHKPENASMPTMQEHTIHSETLPDDWTEDQDSWEFVTSQAGWGTNSILFSLNTNNTDIPLNLPMNSILFDYEVANDKGVSLKDTNASLAIPFHSSTLDTEEPEVKGTFQIVDKKHRVGYIDVKDVAWNHPTVPSWTYNNDVICELTTPVMAENPLPQLHDWQCDVEYKEATGTLDISFEILTDEASDVLDETATYDIGIAFKTPNLSPTEYVIYNLKIQPFAP